MMKKKMKKNFRHEEPAFWNDIETTGKKKFSVIDEREPDKNVRVIEKLPQKREVSHSFQNLELKWQHVLKFIYKVRDPLE